MAGTNDFRPFAIGSGANVVAQSDWINLDSVSNGFKSGVAKSAEVNKALRQGTVMASMIGQFIVDQTGLDALDDGEIATPLANFIQALLSAVPGAGRLINIQQFTSSDTYTPTTGTKKIRVIVVGGGGGGGGCASSGSSTAAAGGGGASGTYFESELFDVPTGSVPITIGAGGTGGAIGANNGYTGGTSAFGSIITCPGGAYGGGAAAGTAVNAPGGSQVSLPTSTVTPVISSPGVFGQHGVTLITSAGNLIIGGSGGSTPYGAGAGWPEVAGSGKTVISSANNAGGGGGGALSVNSSAAAGGAGGAGIIIVYEYS